MAACTVYETSECNCGVDNSASSGTFWCGAFSVKCTVVVTLGTEGCEALVGVSDAGTHCDDS